MFLWICPQSWNHQKKIFSFHLHFVIFILQSHAVISVINMGGGAAIFNVSHKYFYLFNLLSLGSPEVTVKMFYLVLVISRKVFLLLSISDNTERDRRGFVLSLFAASRNSTGQVLEQLNLFVIALSRGLAQMIPRGLFQPKLFYDSLVFIFCLYPTCSPSRADPM